MRASVLTALTLLVATGAICLAQAGQSKAQGSGEADAAHKVPVINGGVGDCSVEIHVTDSGRKPVYGAEISVRLRYGFGGFHKLDLQASTNVDGRARFEGLSERARMPLEFTVVYQGRENVVPVDLREKCHQSKEAVLPDKPTAAQNSGG